MTYTAEISRANPSCFLFLIDQSGSMQDAWPGEPGKVKAEGLATIVNRLLQNVVIKCAKSEGVRDYFDIGVLGYGAKVQPAFGGELSGKGLVSIREIADRPVRIEERTKKMEDGAGGLVDQTIKFPVWFDAVAEGGTPMCHALTCAGDILARWIGNHPVSFPPIVLNITDGEATDGDPALAAEALRNLATQDEHVLLFNIHISSSESAPIVFSDSEDGLPDEYARLLFRISSPLPDYMRSLALQEGFRVTEKTRGFAFNADMVSVIRFLDIGTRPADMR